MGIEYALRFTYPDVEAVTEILRRLPSACERLPLTSAFELRVDGTVHAMADASVQVEPYGVYFCDNVGHGRELLGVVISRLVAKFGTVAVSELEEQERRERPKASPP